MFGRQVRQPRVGPAGDDLLGERFEVRDGRQLRLRRAVDVDGLVTWEPFESIPVMDGYGFFAKGLEYGSSKAVGAELGMFMTTKQAVDGKRAALERFVWVYLAKEEELGKSPAAFASAYAQLTGMAPDVAAQAAKIIKLGEVISPDQIKRQAKGFADLGVIQKDVSEEIDAHWDGSFVDKALGK